MNESTGDSGGFSNPAITVCFCHYRGLPWRRFPIYFLAQFLGGSVDAGVIYANYTNAINDYGGHNVGAALPSKTATAKISTTFQSLETATMFINDKRRRFLYLSSGLLNENEPVLLEVDVDHGFHVRYLRLKKESNHGAMGKAGTSPFFPLTSFFLIHAMGSKPRT